MVAEIVLGLVFAAVASILYWHASRPEEVHAAVYGLALLGVVVYGGLFCLATMIDAWLIFEMAGVFYGDDGPISDETARRLNKVFRRRLSSYAPSPHGAIVQLMDCVVFSVLIVGLICDRHVAALAAFCGLLLVDNLLRISLREMRLHMLRKLTDEQINIIEGDKYERI